MKIVSKLILGFLAVALLVGIVGYVGFTNIKIVSNNFDLLNKQTMPTIDALKDMRIATLTVHISTAEFALIKENSQVDAERALVEQGKTQFNEAFGRYNVLVETYFPWERGFRDDIKEKWNVFAGISDEMIELKEEGAEGKEILEAEEEFEEAEEALLKAIDTALAHEAGEIKEREELVETAVNNALNNILIIILISLILSLGIGLFIFNHVSKPITKLRNATGEIGKGDLDIKIEVNSKDEIGELASSFNQMAEDLKKSQAEIRKHAEELEQKIRERTEELEKKTRDLEKSLGELAKSRMGLINMMEDLNEAKDELERANRFKDLFTDIMRHDLLNPVGVIRNIADILEEDKNLKDSSELPVIKRNVKKLEEIVHNTSDYAKLESVEKLEKTELDLAKLLDSVIDDLGPYIKDKGMKVEFKPGGEYKANASVIIESVFVNLLSNAIKYSPDGTEIKITIEDSDERWKISFADQGDGVLDEYKEAIFDRFARKDKGGVKGTGLGLAIVKRIVEMHGGRVWVEDNPEGGSIFYVEIPKVGV